MINISTITELREALRRDKLQGLDIGFVPTMGFLHDGHLSLINKARTENDRVALSVFVNPLQFGPAEDYEEYPRDLERDQRLAEEAGVDYFFAPVVSEMYPQEQLAVVDVRELSERLCGRSRPGHFKGVATIVCKLINIVKPDRLYMGKKDAQQYLLIKRVVLDLNLDTEVIGVETVRETDGLAMSSRNSRLNKEEREAAMLIPQALFKAKEAYDQGERQAKILKDIIQNTINSSSLVKIEYVEIADTGELREVEMIRGPVVMAVAVIIGKVRLIDNIWTNGLD